MIQVDLITGFLGSGKTTFIREYVKYWSRHGKKIKVIENEFGSVSVDTSLLSGEDCSIDDLSGCCMCCTGKDRFMGMLLDAADEGYDRILVEPSGIYDVDEFFEVMTKASIMEKCEIGSILTIVDAKLDSKLSEESRYLMYAQLLGAGTVIFSKSQYYSPKVVSGTKQELCKLIQSFGSNGVTLPFCDKAWDTLTDDDFEAFADSGYNRFVHDRQVMNHGEIFMTYMTADFCEDQADLEARVDKLFEDPAFGNIIRVKGYIRDLDRNYYEINCTRQDRDIHPCKVRKGLCVVIGQGLKEGLLKERAFIPRKSVMI